MLTSGLSQTFIDQKTNQLAGFTLLCGWEFNPNYNFFPVENVNDWYKVGSEEVNCLAKANNYGM